MSAQDRTLRMISWESFSLALETVHRHQAHSWIPYGRSETCGSRSRREQRNNLNNVAQEPRDDDVQPCHNKCANDGTEKQVPVGLEK